MKKILCLIDSLGAGGAQRQMVGLATLLKEKNYEVTVAIYHENLFYAESLQQVGVPLIYLKKAEQHITRLFQISSFIRKQDPDVVISYLDTPNICSCFSKIFNKHHKLIVSERNTTQHTGFKDIIRFNMYRFADVVVPNSYSQVDYINKTFPFLSDKTVTIPNFVDLEYFLPPPKHKRRTLPEVMIVASVRESKNTLGFIDAVDVLRKKGCCCHISWYGLNKPYNDYINRCIKKIKYLGLNDWIELQEKTQRIKEHYQDADYFCLPSFYEGTPNVIGEAMACGLPLICSNVCDNARYVEENVNGFLFDPQKAESIALAFERAFALKEYEYEQFCSISRKKAEEKLSKDVFINSYIKVIEK